MATVEADFGPFQVDSGQGTEFELPKAEGPAQTAKKVPASR